MIAQGRGDNTQHELGIHSGRFDFACGDDEFFLRAPDSFHLDVVFKITAITQQIIAAIFIAHVYGVPVSLSVVFGHEVDGGKFDRPILLRCSKSTAVSAKTLRRGNAFYSKR